MRHIELRDIADDDLDAIFEMMRDPDGVAQAAFTASDPDDREAFEEWMARNRSEPTNTLYVVTEDGGFAGTAGAFTTDGDREVTYWIARHAQGRGIATAALRLVVSHESARPLFARVASHNGASIAVLEKVGFTEVSRMTSFAPGVGRDVEERVYTLVPTVE